MSDKLKILLVAYSASESEGSEGGAGFAWIRALSGLADLTVVTRENNLQHLAPLRDEVKLVGHDLPRPVIVLKGKLLPTSLYYSIWMSRLPKKLRRLGALSSNQFAWHLTFASVNRNSAVFRFGLPVVWGPVGGRTNFRFEIVKRLGPKGATKETLRYLLELTRRRAARNRAEASKLVIYQNPETVLLRADQKCLVRTNIVMSDSNGMRVPALEDFGRSATARPRILFVSRSASKGERLLESYISEHKPEAHFTILGSVQPRRWNYLRREGFVHLGGRMPHDEYLETLRQHDGFVSLSVRESAGWVVTEALGAGIPVFAFDINGPAGVALQGGPMLKGLTLSSPDGSWQDDFKNWIDDLRFKRGLGEVELGPNFSEDALETWLRTRVLSFLSPPL